MNPTVSASFVCLFAVAGALHAEQPAGLPTVTVRLYNLVEADPEQITQATGEASELFARAGVSVAWANCAGAAPERLCNVAEGPSVVNLRLMPARLAPPGLPRNIFGFALMSTTGGFARTANVYVDSVSAIADGRKYRLPYVLGAMMAHEIGHLLLGQGSHSKHGLMSLPWGPKALRLANAGMLRFSEVEGYGIEHAAVERMAAGPMRRSTRRSRESESL